MANNINSLVDKLNKKFNDILFIGSDKEAIRDERMVFSSPQLTYAFGGLIKGRIIHLFGYKSVGKSSISTYIASQCQKNEQDLEKRYVVYIDFERSFDVDFANQIGLDTDKVIVIRALDIESAFTSWEEIMQTGCVCCTIFDSDATAPTKNELTDEVNKSTFGANALAISRVLRRANPLVYYHKSTFIHISQERTPMNPLKKVAYTGGSAPEYYATYQFRISKISNIENKQTGEVDGILIRARNFKNKGNIPFRDAELSFYFKGGLNPDAEFLDFIFKFGYFKGSGWYTNDEYNVKVQGKDKVLKWLEEHPDVYDKYKQEIMEKLLNKNELDNGNKDPIQDDSFSPENEAVLPEDVQYEEIEVAGMEEIK